MTLHRQHKEQAAHTGLPRLIADNVLWVGGCLDLSFKGETVHSHFNAYVIRGRDKTLMVDSGHPFHRPVIEAALDAFLGDRPLDYIFPTHPELPHCGLMPTWMTKYPGLKAVGDCADYPIYYPEFSDRFVHLQRGDAIDLGDRRFILLPCVWGDLANTLWGYDSGAEILFVSDAYALIHGHKPGECALMTGEQPVPDKEHLQMLSRLTLQWMQYHDVSTTYAELDEFLRITRPRMIAPAHGAVVDRPAHMTELMKAALGEAVTAAMPRLQPAG
jgi:flavorubredoxin